MTSPFPPMEEMNRPGSDGDLVQATSRSKVAVEHC